MPVEGVRSIERGHAGRWLGRYVGLVIASVAVGGALLLWAVVSAYAPFADRAAQSVALFGMWHVDYDPQAPALVVALGAVGLGLLLAAAVAVVERLVLDRSRRSTDTRAKLLAPKLVMAETRGVFGGPVTVTVLIPAHNEAASIGATLDSLRAQEPAPDRVIVIADNCTDTTEAIARGLAAFHRRSGPDGDWRPVLR